MKTILIGIDDTDNLKSPGTGRLARDLCAELQSRGFTSLGVTRHQFLLNKAIPFTSHNSGACIAVKSKNGIDGLDFAFDFIANASAMGSDPGVCIALNHEVSIDISKFGQAAQKKVLKIETAFEKTRGSRVKLHGLGGNCQGVIGALASVGLRAKGIDGRFIDLPGLRELPRFVNVQTYKNLGIEINYKTEYPQPKAADIYDTLGWVRPDLVGGKPLLKVEWSEKENVWIPVERKKKKSSQYSTNS